MLDKLFFTIYFGLVATLPVAGVFILPVPLNIFAGVAIVLPIIMIIKVWTE